MPSGAAVFTPDEWGILAEIWYVAQFLKLLEPADLLCIWSLCLTTVSEKKSLGLIFVQSNPIHVAQVVSSTEFNREIIPQ